MFPRAFVCHSLILMLGIDLGVWGYYEQNSEQEYSQIVRTTEPFII